MKFTRPISFNEAKQTYKWIKENIISLFDIYFDSFVIIGSYGKLTEGETYGDLDIAISSKDIEKSNSLKKDEVIDFIEKLLKDNNFDILKSKGFNQISFACPIQGGEGLVQVDLMISINLEWTKFIYYSPNLNKEEFQYKGIYRNLLLMSIVTETSKVIIKTNSEGEIEELETNVIRFSEGIWRSRRSFLGKKGIIKTAKLLKEFDKFITNDPQQVTQLVVGKEYKPEDIFTFEKLWKIIISNNYIFRDKLSNITNRFRENLLEQNLKIPDLVYEFN